MQHFPVFKEFHGLLKTDEINDLLSRNMDFKQAEVFNRYSKENQVDLDLRKCQEVLLDKYTIMDLDKWITSRLNIFPGFSFTIDKQTARIIKYEKDEYFNKHKDMVSMHSNVLKSYSLLINLKPCQKGGKTVLYFQNEGRTDDELVYESNYTSSVSGSGLLFAKSIIHGGNSVIEGEKIILFVSYYCTCKGIPKMIKSREKVELSQVQINNLVPKSFLDIFSKSNVPQLLQKAPLTLVSSIERDVMYMSKVFEKDIQAKSILITEQTIPEIELSSDSFWKKIEYKVLTFSDFDDYTICELKVDGKVIYDTYEELHDFGHEGHNYPNECAFRDSISVICDYCFEHTDYVSYLVCNFTRPDHSDFDDSTDICINCLAEICNETKIKQEKENLHANCNQWDCYAEKIDTEDCVKSQKSHLKYCIQDRFQHEMYNPFEILKDLLTRKFKSFDSYTESYYSSKSDHNVHVHLYKTRGFIDTRKFTTMEYKRNIAARVIQRHLHENWIGKPVTNDGKMGILARINYAAAYRLEKVPLFLQNS
jgi:hypothetical protein